jgi:hypothetical protein
VISGKLSGLEPDSKNFRKLVDAKWAYGNCEALEQSVGKLSFLLLDP